jgi:hypothetical protein
VQHTFEAKEDALAMLDDAVKKHGLDSRGALLDYCSEDGDWHEIFETIRCRRC